MGPVRSAAAIVLPVLAGFAACSSFRSHGLQPADAGDDAGLDGSASDDGDAADDPTPTATFCDTLLPKAFFCADFERDPYNMGWANAGGHPDPGVGGGGAIAVAMVNPNDEPARNLGSRVAQCTTPALISSMQNALAFLLKSLPVAHDFVIDFQLRIVAEQYGAEGRMVLVDLEFGTVGNSLGAILLFRDGPTTTGVDVFDGLNPLTPVYFTTDVPTNQWREVRIIATNAPVEGGPQGSMEVEVDGIKTASATLPVSLQGQPFFLSLGLAGARGALEPAIVQVDDVYVYRQQ
jgi:hypothetical protein